MSNAVSYFGKNITPADWLLEQFEHLLEAPPEQRGVDTERHIIQLIPDHDSPYCGTCDVLEMNNPLYVPGKTMHRTEEDVSGCQLL